MNIITLSGCSGSGKNHFAEKLIDFLRSKGNNAQFIVSLTTRKQRTGEINGKDYHFVTREEFEQAIKNGQLLEYVEVGGNYYGTPIIEDSETTFVHIVEPSGVLALQQIEKLNLTTIFLFVDNANIVIERLKARIKNATTEKEIYAHEKRLVQFNTELLTWNKDTEHYHYVFNVSELVSENGLKNALNKIQS